MPLVVTGRNCPLYYGIGPEYFYDKELTTDARSAIVESSERAKEISEQSEGIQDKETAFHKVFESMTFEHALNFYMLSMKMLLATADSGKLDKLKTAAAINSKMGERLNAIIELREKEEQSGEPSLFDLIEKVEQEGVVLYIVTIGGQCTTYS